MRNYIVLSTIFYGIMAGLNTVLIYSGHNSHSVVTSLNVDFTVMFIGVCTICILDKLDKKEKIK